MIRGSSSFSEPAAAFRGFANSGSPCSTRITFREANEVFGMYTSPRTSRTGGILLPSVSLRGIAFIVLTFAVTSSPVEPSPLVAARVKRPSS